jgi:hypothetical protein
MGRFLFTLLVTVVISEEELRFTHVYKQGYDTSCGVAVTASLLNTYWNIPITEADLYQSLILDQAGEDAAVYTVSLLSIAEYLKPRASSPDLIRWTGKPWKIPSKRVMPRYLFTMKNQTPILPF